MQTLVEQMRIYLSYHQKPLTKATHFIGIPLAILPIMILLSWVDVGIPGWFHINFSWLSLIVLCIYYFKLDRELAMGAGAGLIVLNLIAQYFAKSAPNWLGFKVILITLIVGWSFQLIGHLIEGKRPALMDNLSQVFIAPLFLCAEIAFLFGKKEDLKKALNEKNV